MDSAVMMNSPAVIGQLNLALYSYQSELTFSLGRIFPILLPENAGRLHLLNG